MAKPNEGCTTDGVGDVRLDKMTDAAVRWLTTHDLKALSDMIGICFIAKKNLFIPDPDHQKSLLDSTRSFIVDFLKKFFVPYEGATPDDIRAAAACGDFKHIGRRCRFAMIDEIRYRTAEKRRAVVYSIDRPIPGQKDLTYAETLEDRPKPSGEPDLTSVWAAHRIGIVRAEDLEKLLGPGAATVLLTVATAVENGKNPAAALATARNVTERQARRYLAKFRQALKEALERSEPLARELRAALAAAGDTWDPKRQPREVPKVGWKMAYNDGMTT